MTGEFPPVTRMGGKRAVAAHVLDILGTWPVHWLMIDADPAIVEFWQASFGGWLPAVAEIVRAAPCDGEELWKLWKDEPVPVHPLERVARWKGVAGYSTESRSPHGNWRSAVAVDREKAAGSVEAFADLVAPGAVTREVLAARNERLARWIVLQKGNFSGKPLSWTDAAWTNVSSYPQRFDGTPADRAEAFWKGVAGYASVSESAERQGWKARFQVALAADRLGAFAAGPGSAMYLDLATSSPVFREGDVVSIDPPYQGTTGYGPTLTRARVVELAEEAHEAGCRVFAHEAEPILGGGPWRHVELERRHGKNQRTWSKQRTEILTLNWEPARTVHHSMVPLRSFSIPDGPLFPRVVESKVYLLAGDR